MAYRKFGTKTNIFIVAVVFLMAIVAFFTFGTSKKNTTQGKTNPQVAQAVYIETTDFKYQKPTGWEKLSTEFLNKEGSVSGIATAPTATVRFTIAMQPVSSSPANDAELKDSTLNTLKKLQNFELIGSGDTKVDGKSGQTYTYRYGDKIKTKQELTTVAYKDNVFLIKFTSTDSDFDNQKTDFSKILTSFKFK